MQETKIRTTISFRQKCRPFNEIYLSRIKEALIKGIEWEKENKIDSISNDPELKSLIQDLLKLRFQNP